AIDTLEQRIDTLLNQKAELAGQEGALTDQIDAETRAAIAAAKKAKPRAPRSGGGTTTSSAELRTVQGITVNVSIAAKLDAMLTAAADDGVTLSGSGWRSSDSQISLRKAHCGSSQYDIWDKP